MVGLLLSLSAPLGWLIVRMVPPFFTSPFSIFSTLVHELLGNWFLYAYMNLGAAVCLVLCGFALGLRDDRLFEHNLKLLVQRRLLSIKNRQLSRLSITDRLTGLANYFRLHEVLSLEFKRARRYDLDLCVILVDIDFFKKINDTHGHLFGDYVLHELGQIFAASRRETDYVARTGGEEFSFILTQTNVGDAMKFAERLRQEVEKHPFAYRGIETKVTLSAGVASIHDIPKSMDDPAGKILLEIADDALYDAKRSGRNRVIRFEPKPHIATAQSI